MIPAIDLQAFPSETAKLIHACEEWGCFRIFNYEGMLPESLVEDMKLVAKSLLELPTEIKMRNLNKIPGSGYNPQSPINPLLESLGIYDGFSRKDVEDFCTDLEASPMQRDVILRYAKAVKEVLVHIAHEIRNGLGVNRMISFEDWISQFKINKYHFSPETLTSSGVFLHTDTSFLTLLLDDKDNGGLEVMKRSGEFVAVDPYPSTLIVNLGDIATAWSNGKLLSVKHRVICKEARTRFSIAAFIAGPKGGGMVEAPSELVDSEHPRLFSPFTFEDYKAQRMSKKLYDARVLESFRIKDRVEE